MKIVKLSKKNLEKLLRFIWMQEEEQLKNATKITLINMVNCAGSFRNTYISIKNDEIIGFLISEETKFHLFITFIYLAPKVQGKGYGSFLLKKLQEKSVKICKPIYCYHNKELLSFYAKNDFVNSDNLTVSLYDKI